MERRALLLLSALAGPASEDAKLMAAVLLRRLFSNEFADLQPNVRILFLISYIVNYMIE